MFTLMLLSFVPVIKQAINVTVMLKISFMKTHPTYHTIEINELKENIKLPKKKHR